MTDMVDCPCCDTPTYPTSNYCPQCGMALDNDNPKPRSQEWKRGREAGWSEAQHAAQRVIEAARHACHMLRRTGNPAEVYLGDVQRALAEYDAAQKEPK